MTYGLGIKLKSGFVEIPDTRITSGTEETKVKKVSKIYKKGIPFL
jgi:20S proteasome alpha/beta subunit